MKTVSKNVSRLYDVGFSLDKKRSMVLGEPAHDIAAILGTPRRNQYFNFKSKWQVFFVSPAVFL
jgi:hypothetical protein